MIELVKPELKDLWFREALMADEKTMLYNRAWGGTIPFPKEKWESWYSYWVQDPGSQRYYRYLKDTDQDAFVGEIAYHWDEKEKRYLCDVVVKAEFRNQGFGSKGIQLLCQAAKSNGVEVLHDDIAADNPSYRLFLKNGFSVEFQDREIVMVKKTL